MKNTYKRVLIALLVSISLFGLCGCQNNATGKLSCEGKASDSDLNIECDGPILVREVAMVQNSKNDNGEVELVLANHPIEDLDNPQFPENLTNKVFYGTIKINDVELTDEQINSLVYSNPDDLVKFNNLPENNGNAYGLVLKDGSYITASNDWKLGEIKITYYTMNIDDSREYSVVKAK